MLIMYHYTEGNLTKRIRVQSLDDIKIIAEAEKKFRDATRKGQVRGEFEEDTWRLFTQGRQTRTIRFDTHKEKIRKMLQEEDYEHFKSNIKTMVMLRFGMCGQDALAHMVRYILDEMAVSGFRAGVSRPKEKDHGMTLNYLIEFLRVTRWGNKEYIQECTKVLVAINAKNAEDREERKHPCIMNEFQSYFTFDHLICDAWKNVMTPLQKEYYFPVYFYRTLTMILPLRVMEFCVIPYDCLTEQDGHYYITVRRTRLKGSTSRDPRIHYYTIDKDYKEEDPEIPKWLYDLVDKWREGTAGYEHPFELLFSVDYMAGLGYKKMFVRSKESTFTPKRLGELLKEFYEEFLIGHYGMKLVTEEELLSRYYDEEDGSYRMYPDEIMMMQLKQTRHLAMINLIRWGCNPQIIKRFAGHSTPQTDANYYGNTSRFVRCATKILWERTRTAADSCIEEEVLMPRNNMQVFIDRSRPYIKVDGGRCYSEQLAKKDYTSCFQCNGRCKKCGDYVADKTDKVTAAEEKKLNEEAMLIIQMLKDKDLDARIEEYQQRMLKLENDLHDYASRLWREFTAKQDKEPEYVYND